MHKKIFALIVTVTCMSTQCRDPLSDNIRSAQIKAAQEALLNNRISRAQMGTIITIFGLAGSIGIAAYDKDNPIVLGICGSAVACGSFIAWTGENEQGNPQERARLITVIENGGSSEQTHNKNSIFTGNDK